MTELTRLGEPEVLIWRKVGPARRVTLPSQKGKPARRVTTSQLFVSHVNGSPSFVTEEMYEKLAPPG